MNLYDQSLYEFSDKINNSVRKGYTWERLDDGDWGSPSNRIIIYLNGIPIKQVYSIYNLIDAIDEHINEERIRKIDSIIQ